MTSSKSMYILLLIALFLKQVFAACDGNHCCFDSDCKSNLCEGGGGVVCKCKKQFWARRFNTGECKDGQDIQDGQVAPNSDYRNCKSRKGVCGYCGTTQGRGRKCAANKDCASGWCTGKFTIGCRGKCESKVPDGQMALSGDSKSCQTGKAVCNYCGSKQDNGRKCSTNSDCNSDWCDGDGSDTKSCGGMCRKRPISAFRTCATNQAGIFSESVEKWTPGCQTATGAVFGGLRELTNLIPTEDETIRDVVENVLPSVLDITEFIAEQIADAVGIGASICLGNFPGKTIVDPEDDDNMIDMCSSIPVEESEDAEWSLFGMSLNIPPWLGAMLCPAVDVETFEVCLAISMCGSYPSIAFAMNGDILGCIAAQPQFAASTLGVSTAVAHAVEKGLQGLGSGFSLTNAFEIPMTIYNGHKRFDYSARPTIMDFVEIGISGGEIHKKLEDWIELSVKLTRGLSIFGPTTDNVESALSKYDAKKGEGDVTNVFNSWTVQAFAKGEVTMTVSFQKVPRIGDILPELEDILLSEVNALISTGEQNIVDDSGETTTIYPGIYLYAGTSAVATAITSIVSTVLKSVWTIIDLMPDWLPIKITPDAIIDKLGLSSDDIDNNDSMGVGITLNTNRAGIFFGMPVLIDALGTISMDCYTDYSSFNCKASYKGNIDKYFTAAVEFLKDGAVWLAKEADKFFKDVGNVLAAAYKDPRGTIENVFSKDNLEKSAKKILDGAINLAGLVGIDSEALKGVATFLQTTFSPEALLDDLGDMVKMVGKVGKELIEDAKKAYQAAERSFTNAMNNVKKYGSTAINWLERELGKVGDDVGRAVVQVFNDLSREISGFIQDVGKFLENGVDAIANGYNAECTNTHRYDRYRNDKDTAHTGCQFKEKGFTQSRKGGPWCAFASTKSSNTIYLDQNCVRDHLNKVNIEKQAKKAKANALASKRATDADNRDAQIALSYSQSGMQCSPGVWIYSKKNGKSMPFSVTCTLDTIMKNGQKRKQSVTKERVIDLSNTTTKTRAMKDLISITKDVLTAKVTASMNGGFVGCFSRSMTVRVGQFHKNPTQCVKECRRRGYKYAGTTTNWECRCSNGDYGREAAGCECATNGNGGGTYNNQALQCVYHVEGS